MTKQVNINMTNLRHILSIGLAAATLSVVLTYVLGAVSVASAQKFPVLYQDMEFDVNVSSPISVQNVTLKPESKQLLIQYPAGEWQHIDDFQLSVDIPNEMMSGPFTAVFNGMQLSVSEQQKDNRITSLFLNGSHLDLIEMNQTTGSAQGMEGMEMDEASPQQEQQQQGNAVIITGASVLPELPLALPVAGVGIATAIAIARKIKIRIS
jgi:hypothetical protein